MSVEKKKPCTGLFIFLYCSTNVLSRTDAQKPMELHLTEGSTWFLKCEMEGKIFIWAEVVELDFSEVSKFRANNEECENFEVVVTILSCSV